MKGMLSERKLGGIILCMVGRVTGMRPAFCATSHKELKGFGLESGKGKEEDEGR